MFKKYLIVFSLGVVFLLSAIPGFAGEKLRIVVSILPQKFFAERIGTENVTVSVMIPPGGNPHTYEPTPGQLTTLSQADVYLKVGSGVEFELAWMDKLMALNKTMVVCDCAQGIRLIAMTAEQSGDADGHHHHPGGQDPHIWLSPDNAIIMTAHIRDALIARDPAHEKSYRENAAALVVALSDLKKEIAAELAGLKNRNFLVFHPSWGYFAADFDLNQIAVEQGGKDPTPKQLAALIDTARKYDTGVILVSPQFSRQSARIIAAEIGGRVVSLDPLAENYMDNLRRLADIVAGK